MVPGQVYMVPGFRWPWDDSPEPQVQGLEAVRV